MARKEHGAAAEMLGELESAADRLGDWLQANFRAIVAAIIALLVVAGVGSWIVSSRASNEREASTALAKAREDYLSAMGVGPGALEVPELANPEAATQIRAEYEERFGEVAKTYAGTIAGTLAALEAARLASDAGRPDDALVTLEQALAEAPARGAVRGMVLQQLAQRLESAGRWAEAADRHEEASKLADYPLRGWALADAARCRAQAGDAAGALALYERLEREMPDLKLPDHQRSEILELRAAANR